MKKKDKAILNFLYFICGLLIISVYVMWNKEQELIKKLEEAHLVIQEQEKAIYTQQLYSQIWQSINNSPVHRKNLD